MRIANKWAVVSILTSSAGLCALLGGAALADHGLIDRHLVFLAPAIACCLSAIAMLIAAIND